MKTPDSQVKGLLCRDNCAHRASLWVIRNGEEFIKSCTGSVEEVLGHLPPLKAAVGIMFMTFEFLNSKLIGLMCWRAAGCGWSGNLHGG